MRAWERKGGLGVVQCIYFIYILYIYIYIYIVEVESSICGLQKYADSRNEKKV